MIFQTAITDLTKLPVANASLLDEASAAAETISLGYSINKRKKFFVADNVFPHTLQVLKTRAKFLDVEIVIGDPFKFDFKNR